MPDELLTINQTAIYLKVSEKTIRRLIKGQLLIASKVGSTWRIKESDIAEYLRKNNNETK